MSVHEQIHREDELTNLAEDAGDGAKDEQAAHAQKGCRLHHAAARAPGVSRRASLGRMADVPERAGRTNRFEDAVGQNNRLLKARCLQNIPQDGRMIPING